MKKQKINCSVYDCKYCNCDIDCCNLDSIKVCNCDSKHKKETTMCDSYEEEIKK